MYRNGVGYIKLVSVGVFWGAKFPASLVLNPFRALAVKEFRIDVCQPKGF